MLHIRREYHTLATREEFHNEAPVDGSLVRIDALHGSTSSFSDEIPSVVKNGNPEVRIVVAVL